MIRYVSTLLDASVASRRPARPLFPSRLLVEWESDKIDVASAKDSYQGKARPSLYSQTRHELARGAREKTAMHRPASPFVVILALALTGLLGACTHHQAYRTELMSGPFLNCDLAGFEHPEDTEAGKRCEHVTPEVAEGAYELHFVEFDDQGWLYPDPAPAGNAPVGRPACKKSPSGKMPANNPSCQIDHLMARLSELLERGDDLSIVVFVHGWKHNASLGDGNVQVFRKLLQAVSVDEKYKSTHGRTARKVVGVYVGWRGKSWPVSDPLLNLSFWTRKDAARRVSVGSARELFARLRSLQRHYNLSAARAAADGDAAIAPSETGVRPRIRTLMIGHSFGGLILYASTFSSLIEVLSAQRDLPANQIGHDAAERIADMIVLINPAFEASRFEPLYQVASQYSSRSIQPPLFVSVTSVSDLATKYAFPAGRSVNTLFEHPVSSNAEDTAMKNTPGHMDTYLTHRLWATPQEWATATNSRLPGGMDALCPHWDADAAFGKTPLSPKVAIAMLQNKAIEERNAKQFFAANTAGTSLKPGWHRAFCGGPFLVPVSNDDTDNANAVVWNVEVSEAVIDGHNDIMNPVFVNFLRQLYADVSLGY
ncbi:hypothetical protein [Paraburkholderia caribensis]|uniref:hypothetical protein n=1 Tax=Paraburkholderia caribensis TaxID=75105 RepID=UPI0034D31EC2